ncbi:hypothetical protein ACP70R_035046 [Stipagrostis hirtigluma subsp. patula]
MERGAMSEERAALLREQAQMLRDHGALMKERAALVDKAVGQAAAANRVLAVVGAALQEHGDKLERRADLIDAQLQPPQPHQASSATGGFWRTVRPFVNGGAAGMLATCVIQPVDMVKLGQIGENPVG